MPSPRPVRRRRPFAGVRKLVDAEARRHAGLDALSKGVRKGRNHCGERRLCCRCPQVAGFEKQGDAEQRIGTDARAPGLRGLVKPVPVPQGRLVGHDAGTRLKDAMRTPDAPVAFGHFTPSFLDDLADLLAGKRVLEVFAGNGLLAASLAQRGIAITATSLFSGHDGHRAGLLYPVIELDAVAAVHAFGNDADILLMSWPTTTDAAAVAALVWGPVRDIIFIGEVTDYGKGHLGGCATDLFFEVRLAQWSAEHARRHCGHGQKYRPRAVLGFVYRRDGHSARDSPRRGRRASPAVLPARQQPGPIHP